MSFINDIEPMIKMWIYGTAMFYLVMKHVFGV
jgi:hypothetical protein